ncbi:hypothetical protein CU097_003730, partial [Rhizopus azygosporus]
MTSEQREKPPIKDSESNVNDIFGAQPILVLDHFDWQLHSSSTRVATMYPYYCHIQAEYPNTKAVQNRNDVQAVKQYLFGKHHRTDEKVDIGPVMIVLGTTSNLKSILIIIPVPLASSGISLRKIIDENLNQSFQ